MLMQREIIRIAEQFSRFPYGRYPDHGPNNGERFREEYLIPALRDGRELAVDLDGARGLGPSFLEEAFGGLVRAGFSPEQINSLIRVNSEDDPSYLEEIQSYINDAAALVGAAH